MTLLRFFRWEVNAALGVLLAGAVVAVQVWMLSAVHQARRIEQERCAESVRLMVQAKPVLDRTVRLADACVTLATMKGE